MKNLISTLLTLLLLLVFGLLSLPKTAHATLIVPPESLEDFALNSDAIVLAKAQENYLFEEGTLGFNRTNFQILDVISGSIDSQKMLTVQTAGGSSEGYTHFVTGAAKFKKGVTYLLFLRQKNGQWQPMLMSYGLLEEVTYQKEKLFKPIDSAGNLDIYVSGNQNFKSITAYKKTAFVSYLKALASNAVSFNKAEKNRRDAIGLPKYNLPIEAFSHKKEAQNTHINADPPPAFCTWLGGGGSTIGSRFQQFPIDFYTSGTDPNFTDVSAEDIANDAVNELNNQYGPTVNIQSKGSVNYTSCSGGGVSGGLPNFMESETMDNPGKFNMLLIFNDPCDEIIDLTASGGILGIGGGYFCGSHQDITSSNWISMCYAYLVMNQGVLNFFNGNTTPYFHVVTHELTHALGIGHIDQNISTGNNMDPNCCKPITDDDRACLDYTYNNSETCPIGNIADAGTDQTVNDCDTTLNISANTVGNLETGSWTVIEGSASISNPNNPTTTVSNLSDGDNIFRWTIQREDFGQCESTDEVKITANCSNPCANLGGDTDGDGVCDNDDNCPDESNPDQADNDGDGIGNLCDPTPDPLPCDSLGGDTDGDGVCDNDDNCPNEPNPDQADNDGDGIGNLCDLTPDPLPCDSLGGDTDGDGVCDNNDNCPNNSNVDQADNDGDGIGNVCDPTPDPLPCADLGGDTDGDGVCDNDDNCPNNSNVDQADDDGDGIGNACDDSNPDDICQDQGGDRDGDGICNNVDNCPSIANPNQADTDGDGIGDACETAGCNLETILEKQPRGIGLTAFVWNIYEIYIKGGTPPYSYVPLGDTNVKHSMINSNTIRILAGRNATFQFKITDRSNCSSIVVSNSVFDIMGYSITPQTSIAEPNGIVGVEVKGGSGDYSYKWNGPSCPCPKVATIGELKEGWYSVLVTDNQSGETASGWYWLPYQKRGRGKLASGETSINAYPNPARTIAGIEIGITTAETVKVDLYNIAGKKIANLYHNKMEANDFESLALNVEDYPNGVYILRLQTASGKTAHQKLVVSK